MHMIEDFFCFVLFCFKKKREHMNLCYLGGFMIVCKLGFSILVMVVGGQFHNKGFVSFANIGYSEHAVEIRRRC